MQPLPRSREMVEAPEPTKPVSADPRKNLEPRTPVLSSPTPRSATPQVTSVKKTTMGAIYTRDSSRPSLGEAYADSRGLIWGDIAGWDTEHDYGDFLNFAQASAFCARGGNRLPTKKEYEKLAIDHGQGSENGYVWHDGTPEEMGVLAHTKGGMTYWSSTIFPGKKIGYAFFVNPGVFLHYNDLEPDSPDPIGQARCVFDSKEE
jgi:hypothetical protein